jgi:hypothetical protein
MPKSLFVAAVAAFVFVTPAHADPIMIFCTCVHGSAGMTLTPLTGGMLEVPAGGAAGPNATFQNDDNAASLNWTDMIGGPVAGNTYPLVGAGSLSYGGHASNGNGDSDALQGSINWNAATYSPIGGLFHLIGTGIVTDSSGDAAFKASFPTGAIFDINATFLTPCAFVMCSSPNQPEPAGFSTATVTPTGLAPSPPIDKPTVPLLASIALIMLVGRFRQRAQISKSSQRHASISGPLA